MKPESLFGSTVQGNLAVSDALLLRSRNHGKPLCRAESVLVGPGLAIPSTGPFCSCIGALGYANCATLGAALNRGCTSRPTEQSKGSAVGRLASRNCSGAGRCALRPPCARVGSGLGFTNRGAHRFRSPERRSCRSRKCLGPHRAEFGKVTSGDSIVPVQFRPMRLSHAFRDQPTSPQTPG